MSRIPFSQLSVKWQMLLVSIFLVTVPTAILGVMVYDTMRAEALAAVESRLNLAVVDWRIFLASNIDGRRLDDMNSQRINGAGYLWIIDGQGNYILSPERRRDGENVLDAKDVFSQPLVATMLTEARSGVSTQPLLRYYDWPGESYGAAQKVAAYVWLPSRNWLLVASSPYDDTVTSLGHIRNLVLLVCLAAIVLGSLIGYLFALLLILPIVRLEKYVGHIAGGDTSVKIDPDLASFGSEVGSLARSFDVMARSLDEKVQRLERQDAKLVTSERSLKQERDFTRAVISSTVVGLIVVDAESRITLCNEAAASYLGLTTSTCEGRPFGETVILRHGLDGKDEGASTATISQAVKFGQIGRVNVEDGYYCTVHEAGGGPARPFPIALVAAPLRGQNQAIQGAVVAFQDVTEAKALEDARKSFICVASHQLRTPITTLRWFIDTLVKDDTKGLDEEQRSALVDMGEVVDRMNNLVKMLLQIARVEMGRVRIEPKPTDFVKLVRNVVTSLQSELGHKGQTVIVTATPPEMPPLLMDPDVVWQVVLNLVTNASRYSANGSSTEITMTLREKEGDVLFAIADHGIGIPDDQRSRLFTKFFRAENAIAAVSYGSGLGLNFAKQLVDAWGGRIWFDSVEGSGSTFYFTFPLAGMKPRAGEVKINA